MTKARSCSNDEGSFGPVYNPLIATLAGPLMQHVHTHAHHTHTQLSTPQTRTLPLVKFFMST